MWILPKLGGYVRELGAEGCDRLTLAVVGEVAAVVEGLKGIGHRRLVGNDQHPHPL